MDLCELESAPEMQKCPKTFDCSSSQELKKKKTVEGSTFGHLVKSESNRINHYCVSPVQHPSFLPLSFFFLRIATKSVRFVLPGAFLFYKYVFLIAIFH